MAPSAAASSAICAALRVTLPWSSIATAKFPTPGLSIGLASFPRPHDKVGGDNRQASVSVIDDRESVCKLEGVGNRHSERPLGAFRRGDCAPRRIGVDRFITLRDGRMLVRYLGTEIALAGQAVHDCPLLTGELLLGKDPDAAGCCVPIPLDVALQVGRVSKVMIVLVQAIGDASESLPSRSKVANEIRLNRVPRAIDFVLVRAFATEARALRREPSRFLPKYDRAERLRRARRWIPEARSTR